MSHTTAFETIVLSAMDLQTVEQVILMRCTTARAEQQRAERMRALMRVSLELTRTLSTYSRHALVHCQGTAGSSDLSADTERLTEALGAFCQEVGAVSGEYATLVGTAHAPTLDEGRHPGGP